MRIHPNVILIVAGITILAGIFIVIMAATGCCGAPESRGTRILTGSILGVYLTFLSIALVIRGLAGRHVLETCKDKL